MRLSTLNAAYINYLTKTDELVVGKAKQSREMVMRRAAFVNVVGKAATQAELAAVIGLADHSGVIHLRKKHLSYLKYDTYHTMMQAADDVFKSIGSVGDVDYLKSLAMMLQDRLDSITLHINKIEQQ